MHGENSVSITAEGNIVNNHSRWSLEEKHHIQMFLRSESSTHNRFRFEFTSKKFNQNANYYSIESKSDVEHNIEIF